MYYWEYEHQLQPILPNLQILLFKISGFKVSGTLQVEDSAVLIKGEIPFAALLFKGQIENSIREKALELLEKK